ncbi:MAG: ribonuclease J [Chloroflexota bacterium]
MQDTRVRIIPLGGYGEVGKNCTAVECGDDLIIIDCGLKFPEDDMPGVDVVLPDFSFILQNKERLRGLLLTHAHEDHLGALPYLLSQLETPVYATRLTHGLLASKLRDGGAAHQLTVIQPGESVTLGGITAEFFHVDHSIPDCVGMALHTKAGTIVHSSDFKFDQTPTDGIPTDFAKLAELGTRGVLALICDCVRVERPGYTPSEQTVADSLDQIFSAAPGRIIFTTFASNISRIQQVMYAAYRYGRKVGIVGRSLESNLSVATDLGYFTVPEQTLVSAERLGRLPPEEGVFIVTGSQGEPTSVLSRIAADEHKQVKIAPGDTVIISASPIPGNEMMVARTIDGLFRQGADVVYDSLRQVHVSGHASQEEIKLLLNLVRPRFCVPFHGDYRHMVLFRRLAGELGYQPEDVLMPSLGQSMEFSAAGARFGEREQAGAVFVDGATVGDIGQTTLKERRQLSRDGVVCVSLVLDKDTGQPWGRPQIAGRGFLPAKEMETFANEAAEYLIDTLTNRSPNGGAGPLAQELKELLSRYAQERTRRRPVILPTVTEL